MKTLIVLAVTAAALATSACVTVIDADSDWAWHGQNAQPFDAARDECSRLGDARSTAFVTCMADKGWVRS